MLGAEAVHICISYFESIYPWVGWEEGCGERNNFLKIPPRVFIES